MRRTAGSGEVVVVVEDMVVGMLMREFEEGRLHVKRVREG